MGTRKRIIAIVVMAVLWTLSSPKVWASCDNQTSLIEGFLQRNRHWIEVEDKNSKEIARRNPILIDINFRDIEKTKILTFKDQGTLLSAIKSKDFSQGKPQLSSINGICFKDNVLEIQSDQGTAKLFYTGEVLNAQVRYGFLGSTFYFRKK